jgi:hypothetical protein
MPETLWELELILIHAAIEIAVVGEVRLVELGTSI